MTEQNRAEVAPMNMVAVVGFVLSLLGFNVIAIILGAIGLSQVKKRRERGRGFALAAIWIGALSIVVLLVILIIAITYQATTAS